MTAQPRRAPLPPAPPRARSAPGAARAPGARAPNPKPGQPGVPVLAIVPNPAPVATAKPITKPDAEQNPRRRKGKKGRRKNPARKRNPIASGLGLLAIGAAAAGVGYLGYRAYSRKRALNRPLAESLASVIKPGATLAEVPFIVADVQQPIALATTIPLPSGYSYVPELIVHAPGTLSNDKPIALRNVEFGSGVMGVPNDLEWDGRGLDGKEITGVAGEGVSQAIGSLVVNVTPEFARQAYERVLVKMTPTTNWDIEHDKIIASVLQVIAPSVDWTKGLPGAKGDAASQVWYAVQSIGAVASQSYWNKAALTIQA